MRKLVLLAVLALALGASIAQADNGSFYLGAGVTTNKLHDIALQGTGFPNIDSTSWKAFIGFRPIRQLAVEVDYLDLGNSPAVGGECIPGCCMLVCRGSYSADAQAFAAYALGFLTIPLPFLDIYGKAGLARWKLNGNEFSSVAFSDQGTDFAWGVGVQAHIKRFGARIEYEQFNIANTSGAKVASLSVFFSF